MTSEDLSTVDPASLNLAAIGDPLGAPNSDDTSESLGETKQFISFRIGEEEYGVDIINVREIKGWVPITPLPNTPDYMLGVLNLRGVIVPIFDMRCRFGLGHTKATPLHVMIILSVEDRIMGILVDAVSDILTAGSKQIMDVPDLDQRGDRKFLSGLLTHDEKMVALLSLKQLFDINTIVDQMGK